MQAAKTNEYPAGFAARPSSLAGATIRVRVGVVFGIVAVGVVLRLYGIATNSLVVDEYNSIAEGQQLGLNWNSIIYSTVMHFWLPLGTSELWLRLPAAIFGMATVPVLFKAGEELGGWRTGAVAALLAATSPFNIFHSQEVRFYSLFMLAAAAFLLATVHYAQSKASVRNKVLVVAAGSFLLVSHFLGFIALYSQAAATFLATKRRRFLTVIAVTVGIPLIIFGLPLLSPVRRILLYLYWALGNARSADPSTTPVSLLSVAKIVFGGFTFVFGYHVYPLRFLAIGGSVLTIVLIVGGIARLAKERKWAAIALTHGVAVVGVYVVLDSVGGRVANGVSPRHVAFVWPAFTLLLALGLTRFHRGILTVLLVALVSVNTAALVAAWTKDWSYAVTTDYRGAAERASRWSSPNTLLVYGPRAVEPTHFYFPSNLARADWSSYLQDPGSFAGYERVIFVNDDWQETKRDAMSVVLKRLSENYTCVDGRVEYPLFGYVFDRRPPTDRVFRAHNGTQLSQPLSIYGLEFQDLKLPIVVNAKGNRFEMIGASQLPDSDGDRTVTIVTGPATGRNRLILLTNAVLEAQPDDGASIAELVLESDGIAKTIPLRLGIETNTWDRDCPSDSPCETVVHWRKRIAIVGQSSYPGAWRDFQAGIHAVSFELPANMRAEKISIRYLASSGHLYLWAIALAS